MKRITSVIVIAAVLVIGLMSTAAVAYRLSLPGTHSQDASTISQERSGLAAADPLNKFETQQQLQSNTSYWQFGGAGGPASGYYNFFEDAFHLHIGVSASGNGTWAGYYAVTPPTNASLVHAILTAPTAGSVSGYYDTGLYMQASNEYLNYIACLAISTPNGTVWGVVQAEGSSLTNTVITPLWVDQSPHQAVTRDCTIISTGTSISVYLDHVLVYENDLLSIPAPYSFFVEDESLIAGHTLYGQYEDFYAAYGGTVQVDNAPSNAAAVALVSTSGKVLASSPVVSGRATLNVANYTFPLSAYVRAYSSSSQFTNSTLVGATPSPHSVYGGDIYVFGKAPSPVVSLNLQADDMSGHDLNGIAVTLSAYRNAVSSDFFPTTFSLNSSQTYTVTAYDYGSYTFDHWSDGSTLRVLTISITKNTNLVAYYRNVNAAPPPGNSLVSVSAVDASGKPLPGMTVTLWQNGVLTGITYTPGTFITQQGVGAFIVPSDYGNYVFSHWSNGDPDRAYAVISGGSETKLVAVYTLAGQS